MSKLLNAKLLYTLYQYQALGYKYIHDINLSHKNDTISLPNDLNEMKKIASSCYLCPLAKTRKNVVFGEGDENADLMFIGEGPGVHEDEQARPFVGLSGQLLDKIINNVFNAKRSQVYIANIVKCRPPNNRVPSLDEVAFCRPYILQQIKTIKPKLIIALGSTSYHHLTKKYDTKISQVRGEVFDFEDTKLIPTFHPSFLLRNPSAKKLVFNDMLRAKRILS